MTTTETTSVPDSALPLARFRAHLRMGTGFAETTVQDALLTGFLRAAMAAIEGRTGKALIRRGFRQETRDWERPDSHRLPVTPVASITAISLMRDSAATPLPEGSWHLTGETLSPAGACFPAPGAHQSLRIDFTAGFGADFDAVPADLAQAVLLLAAHYHEHRDETSLSRGCMPFGVTALIERYRPLRLSLGGRG